MLCIHDVLHIVAILTWHNLWFISLPRFFSPHGLSFLLSLPLLLDHRWVWFGDSKLWGEVTKVPRAEFGGASAWPYQLQLPLWAGGPGVGHGGDVFTERSTQRSVAPLAKCSLFFKIATTARRWRKKVDTSYLVRGSYELFQKVQCYKKPLLCILNWWNSFALLWTFVRLELNVSNWLFIYLNKRAFHYPARCLLTSLHHHLYVGLRGNFNKLVWLT